MEIFNIVTQQGKARVEDLAEDSMSQVSPFVVTWVFRENGYIVRSHGSAIPNTGVIAELTVHEKRRRNSGVKSLIGQAAAKLINSGDTVILDSGTTTREIAANLRSVENVVVMTNGLDVAMG